MSEKEPTDYDVTSQREARVADPTASAGEAPMYVPPNSAPVLQSLIAEAAKLGHWALHEQLCGVLASVDAERRRHAEEVARLEEQSSGSWVRLKDPRDLDPGTYRCMYKHGEPLDLDWDGEAWTGVPSPPVFVFVPNRRSLFARSCEAEELRSGLEKLMADGDPRGADIVSRDSLQALLDKVDARDSLFTLETIDSLRDQLRRVEGERDALAVRMDLPASQLLMVGSELCGDGKIDPNDHRDPRWTPSLQQAAKVMRELTSLRSLLPDVRLIAESATGGESCPEVLTPAARAARRILAALDFHECPECHMPGHHKMSCSRGGSKGGRFSVQLTNREETES